MIDDDLKDLLVDGDEAPEARIAKAIEPLKAQLAQREQDFEALRKAKDEAEQTAYSVRQEAAAREAETQLYAAATQRAAIANALAAHEADIKHLQEQIARAVEVADGTKVAELQYSLSEKAANKATLRHGLEQLEHDIERMRNAPAPKIEAPRQTGDAYEQALAGLSPKLREWAKAHKEKGYIKPGEPMSPKLLKAYWDAKAEGFDESSDRFTAHMDRVLGHVQDQSSEEVVSDASERFQEAPAEPAKKQPAAKKPLAAAPVSRESNTGGIRTSKGTYRLTAEQLQTAQRTGMTPEEYVLGIQEAIKRGKMPASALQ